MRSNFRTRFVQLASVIVAGLMLPVAVRAELAWKTQRIELMTKPGDKEAVALFPFENSGKATVTITSVHPSCGCTTAELDKRAYAPGESGEIKAIFTLGDRVGEQEKTVYVTTDDPSVRPVPLVMHVLIPELLTCSPRLLVWNIGEDVSDKTTTITANGKLKITSIGVPSIAPAEVAVRIEPIEAGVSYRLYVHPVSSAKVMNVPVAGSVTFADGMTQPLKIYVLVR